MKMRFPYFLSSPTVKGPDVKAVQGSLHESPFGNFKPGTIDGEYGEQTAGATRRAKYWLGYPKDQINGRYGETLHSFLTGTKKLPTTYRTRRYLRVKRAGQTPVREEALKKAKSQLGVKENPAGSNVVKFSTWYGLIGSWCAMFVTWSYEQAKDTKTFAKGSKYAYTPYMVRDARAGVNGMSLLTVNEVKPGDIVMYDWGGAGLKGGYYATDHTGLFEKWINKASGEFTAIEGNTAVGNDSNGGEVMRRTRTINFVSALIRVEV